jgi:signal transduction histidine kinase/DNA-binding LacI/PurR family transcriptional regulator
MAPLHHSRRRPTIGMLIDNIAAPEGAHQTRMWSIVAAAAQKMDVNLICFLGGMLGGYSPLNQFEYQRNVVYDLATTHSIDGLIVSSTIGTLIPYEKFQEFCKRFHPLPIVSLGTPLPGIPSIVVEHKVIGDLVAHLIEGHGYRRIGFIRGSETSIAAEKRYHAYLETLARYDIPFDPALVAPGNSLTSAGAAAVDLYLDERHLRPQEDIQAIVAASDNMALGAMEALLQRGIQVPGDIALAGVDDLDEARVAIPSLTTVRHALHEMGTRAVELLLDILAGNQVAELTVLPEADLMLRQSCGCFYQTLQQSGMASVANLSWTLEQALSNQRDSIIADMAKAIGSSSAVKLLDAFVASLQKRESTPNPFLYVLHTSLRQAMTQGGDTLSWHRAMSVLRHRTLPYLTNENLVQAVDLWQQAGMLIGDTKRQVEIRWKLRDEQQAETLRDVSEALITTFDLTSLVESIAYQLPRLEIRQCFVSLYEHDPGLPTQKFTSPSEWSRLILAYVKDGTHEIGKEESRFLTHEIIPHRLLPQERNFQILVDSLHFREQLFGLIVFEMETPGGVMCATLRTQISAALKTAFLQQEYKRAEQNLARSNQELEQFAYVASHDLQEPLRMVRSYLQLLERRYQGQIDSDVDAFIGLAIEGASRMQCLIKDLLQYSRVSTRGSDFEAVDCNEILKEALFDLEGEIEAQNAAIHSRTLPVVMADKAQLLQLFENLISNAIRFQDERTPDIHIEAKCWNDGWQFSVRDNGIGIDPDCFERVFVIFQKLNGDKYPGTGIGLALCRKIVERHSGTIWLESTPGQGSIFYFTIPAVSEKAED